MKYEQSFRFSKEEIVAGETRIENLFKHGKSFIAYPLRVVYLETLSSVDVPASVLISIPKKRIKSAVNRNRMKRLIRETYRLNKHQLVSVLSNNNIHLDIAFIYLKEELSDYALIETGMHKALNELSNKFVTGR